MTTRSSRAGKPSVGPSEVEANPDRVTIGPDQEALLEERRSASRKTHASYVYHRLLAISDFAAIVVAAILAEFFSGLLGHGPDLSSFVIALAIMVPFWFVIAYLAGLYHQADRSINQDFVDEIGLVVVAVTAWSWGFAVAQSWLNSGVTRLTAPVITWLLMIVLLMAFRGLVRHLALNRRWNRRPVAIIGDSFGLSALADRMNRHPEWALEVRSEIVMDTSGRFVVRKPEADSAPPGTEPVAGTELRNGELVDHLLARDVDRAIFAGGSTGFSMRSEMVRRLVENGIVVDFVAGGPETVYPSTSLHHLEGMTVMSTQPSSQQPLAIAMKRALDVSIALPMLLFSTPALIVAAIAIRLDSPGPVLFRQPRGGRNGETFDVVKLRTMEIDADSKRDELRSQSRIADGEMLKVPDDPRVTSVGRYLRHWSIDEIPQLWNVLIGEMSLVGPRPLPLDEAAFVTPEFKARGRMRPGITGPWQVMGRSDIPMQDMLKLDYTYVVGWSFIEDLKLLLRTMSAVFRRSGAR